MKNINAVIFDMDGIIVDSEPWQMKAFNLTLKPFNISLSEEDFIKLIGIRSIENFKQLKKKYNLPVSAEELTETKNNYYKTILKNEIKPREGLIELLNFLFKNSYKIAVASGSIKKDVIDTLELLDIKHFFRVILSGDDVKEGKPDPEIFIKTADKLKIPYNECLVIEDSQTGVYAANAAGMQVIAIPTHYTQNHNFSKAVKVLKSLKEVIPFLKQN